MECRQIVGYEPLFKFRRVSWQTPAQTRSLKHVNQLSASFVATGLCTGTRQNPVPAKTPGTETLVAGTSPGQQSNSNPEPGDESGRKTTPEPPMSVWPSGFESDGLHESFYQCSAADSRGPTQQKDSPVRSQSLNLLGSMSAAEGWADRGSNHNESASLSADPQKAQSETANRPQCIEKGSVCLAASPKRISPKDCHVQQRSCCSSRNDLAPRDGSATDIRSGCSTSEARKLPHVIPSWQTNHTVQETPGALHATKPVSGKVLSKNAAAAAQEAQRRLAQQNQVKAAKLEGWDSDSDMESI